MGRIKRQRTCYKCGAPFTWEQTTGSVRQHNLDGSLHYCSKKNSPSVSVDIETTGPVPSMAEFVNKWADDNTQSPSSKSNQDQTQQSNLSEQSNQRNEQTDEPKQKQTENQNEDKQEKKPENQSLYNLVRPYVLEDIDKKVEPIVELVLEKLSTSTNEFQTVTHEIVVTNPDETKTVIKGAHKQTAILVKYVSLGLNVMLVGPTGSGKTTAAEHCAEALGLNFYPISLGPQTSKTDLLGYTDAHGRPIWTVVRQAYVNGGLLLLDEIDASNAGVLTCLNALLANGHTTFPASADDPNHVTVESKHKDFRVIASANTYGLGSNRMYVGRQQLDAATLDRFVGIDWDYDTDFETRAAASQPDWLRYVHALRGKANELKLRVIFGTRAVLDGVKMLDAGIPRKDVEDARLWFGVSTDDRAKLTQVTKR